MHYKCKEFVQSLWTTRKRVFDKLQSCVDKQVLYIQECLYYYTLFTTLGIIAGPFTTHLLITGGRLYIFRLVRGVPFFSLQNGYKCFEKAC